MPRLAFSPPFWQAWDNLDNQIRSGVRKAMKKFAMLSVAELRADKGVHLESVRGARDPRMRTIRIDQSWRGVVLAPDDGSDVFLLTNVVSHDEAYDGAAKQLYTVNTATRALEVRDVVAIEQLTPELEEVAAKAPTLLFAKHSDTVLRELGIDAQVLRAARAMTDKAQLDAFGGVLPEDQCEVLQFLAEGFTPEEVYRDLVVLRRPADPIDEPKDSLAMAIANATSRITMVTGPDELAEILSKPFAAWRVFLHPSQRWVAYRPSYSGPAQVTGGPGTGKTVVALHRVKHLLDHNPEGRVLLTTFTTALARSLRQNLDLLLDDEEPRARVDVRTVNAYAREVVGELSGRTPALLEEDQELKIWRRLRRHFELPWSEEFLLQEHRHVIVAQRVQSKAEYLTVQRRGRGVGLGARQREQLWQAIEGFRLELQGARATTHLLICAQAADLLNPADDDCGLRYRHVVVDEAQDLHPAQWRLLRAAVPEGSDDLFITGDPHQRIYDNRVSLRALGISVAGRSGRLRINYRSTAEILAWSTGVMDGSSLVEDLGGEGGDNLLGYRSLLRGERPHLSGHGSQQAEIAAAVDRVRGWIGQGVLPSEIAISARFNAVLDKVREQLTAAGIPNVLVKGQSGAAADGVRLASMHAMKGLEFRCVVLVGVTAKAIPFQKKVAPAEFDRQIYEDDLQQQRCLLFVACTRAREALAVYWHGTPSPFLPLRTRQRS